MIPKYSIALQNMLKATGQLEEEVVREARLLNSVENNTDPNDMPLEVAKNLAGNLGPVDTEAEIEKYIKDKPTARPDETKDDSDEAENSFHP